MTSQCFPSPLIYGATSVIRCFGSTVFVLLNMNGSICELCLHWTISLFLVMLTELLLLIKCLVIWSGDFTLPAPAHHIFFFKVICFPPRNFKISLSDLGKTLLNWVLFHLSTDLGKIDNWWALHLSPPEHGLLQY